MLRDQSITQLCKVSRHIKATVLLSSQYWKDIDAPCRLQIDYLILLARHPEDKIEQIHKEADLSIDLQIFKNMYKGATAKAFDFLYVDVKNDKYRLNFNRSITI